MVLWFGRHGERVTGFELHRRSRSRTSPFVMSWPLNERTESVWCVTRMCQPVASCHMYTPAAVFGSMFAGIAL